MSSTGSFSLKQAYCGLHAILIHPICAILSVTRISLLLLRTDFTKILSRLVRFFIFLKGGKNTNYFSLPVVITAIFVILICSLHVHAQEMQVLDVTINEADGDVEIMLPNTFQWIPAPSEAGTIFSEGTQIRTGPFSSVSLIFADSSVVMVDSFTFMTVEKFFKTGNVVTTKLNLIVGSIVNTLNEGTQYENKYNVATPTRTITLSGGEIKKVVAGAMYEDSVVIGYKKQAGGEGVGSESTGYMPEEEAGEIAREQQRQKESSRAPAK